MPSFAERILTVGAIALTAGAIGFGGAAVAGVNAKPPTTTYTVYEDGSGRVVLRGKLPVGNSTVEDVTGLLIARRDGTYVIRLGFCKTSGICNDLPDLPRGK